MTTVDRPELISRPLPMPSPHRAAPSDPAADLPADLDRPDDEHDGVDDRGAEGRLDDDPDADSTSSHALWENDEGSLTESQRRALVVLVKQRFITAQTHTRDWATLLTSLRPLQARLNDLFLDLVVDRTNEVAYKVPIANSTGGRPYPTLLHDQPWNREETTLLVHLRSRHHTERAGGNERAFVDRADLLEHIARLRPSHATNQAGDAKRTKHRQ